MTESLQFGASGRRRRMAVPAAIAAATVGLGSAAWACVPSTPDKQTKIESCTVPAGSPKPCKTPIGQPVFPNATFVKGPSGSSIVAYVNGPGLTSGRAYELVYLTKAQLEAGTVCSTAPSSAKIGGPVISGTNQGVGRTTGVIPVGASLGLGQTCFTDVTRTATASTPASFKVTL